MRTIFIPLSKAYGLYVAYTGATYALTMLPVISGLLSPTDDEFTTQTMASIFGTNIVVTGISFTAVLLITIIAALLMGWSYWHSNYSATGRAWKAVHELADAMTEFHDTHGRWPQNLGEIEDPALIEYEGVKFEYDPDALKIDTLGAHSDVGNHVHRTHASLRVTHGFGRKA